MSSPNERLMKCIGEVRRELDGNESGTSVDSLIASLLNAMTDQPAATGREALYDLVSELKANSAVFELALSMKLAKGYGIEIPESQLAVRIIQIGDQDFRVETNLEQRCGLTAQDAYKAIEAAILAVGNLSLRLEEMHSYQALSGLMDEDLPLFERKFALLANALSPEYFRQSRERSTLQAKERALARVLEVRNLPTFDFLPIDRSFDMDRFLAIRESGEAYEFRRWIRGLEKLTEREIRTQVGGFRNRLAPFVHSGLGKTARVAVSFGVGKLGLDVGGLAFSILETFVLERIFPLSGPALFLSKKYSSLFASPPETQGLKQGGGICRLP